MALSKTKASRLKCTDFSRKGEIDQFIISLVEIINSYFTTSSCSGRIILFSESLDEYSVRKKGCRWLFVSHESASTADIISALDLEETKGEAVFKFEPFVLHVQCETTEHARKMHQAAVASGFRNSGITIGNGGKIMAAIRSTHGLEVPLTKEGRLLVSEDYIDFIVSLANSKMKENFNRIEKFQDTLQAMFREEKRNEADPNSRKNKHGRRLNERHPVKHKLTQTDTSDTEKDLDVSQSDVYENTKSFTNKECYSIDSRNTGDSESDCNVMTDLQGFAFLFKDSDEKT
eukprot:XP_003729633.1 PREDICTED: tRNA wybutosine-synthesizing protein 3 homolog [Strongylocentrotus purpuratus]